MHCCVCRSTGDDDAEGAKDWFWVSSVGSEAEGRWALRAWRPGVKKAEVLTFEEMAALLQQALRGDSDSAAGAVAPEARGAQDVEQAPPPAGAGSQAAHDEL